MSNIAKLPTPSNDDELPLIPDGDYVMTYHEHRCFPMFNRYCCVVTFRIIQFGKYFDVTLPRYYNCHRNGDRSITAGSKSSLYREYCAIIGRRPDRRRITVSRWKDVRVIGRVRNVTKDKDQDDLPEVARYSKVQKIMRRDLV